MHLVSSVEGKLAPARPSSTLCGATFPAGTLSGAPKVRAMQIIEAHEPTRRGLYGGVVGYFGFNGGADLAIAIRTMVETGGKKYFQTGAGIVHDSNPQAEYQERSRRPAPSSGHRSGPCRPEQPELAPAAKSLLRFLSWNPVPEPNHGQSRNTDFRTNR